MSGSGTTLDSVEVLWEREDSTASELALYARRGSSLELDTRTRMLWTPAEKRFVVERLAAVLGSERVSLDGAAEIVWGENGFASSGLWLRGEDGAGLRVDGVVPDSGAADLAVEVRGLDLASVFRIPDEALPYGGLVDAEGHLRGTADDPGVGRHVRGNGSMRFAAFGTGAWKAMRTTPMVG